jgi:hypothetical protein
MADDLRSGRRLRRVLSWECLSALTALAALALQGVDTLRAQDKGPSAPTPGPVVAATPPLAQPAPPATAPSAPQAAPVPDPLIGAGGLPTLPPSALPAPVIPGPRFHFTFDGNMPLKVLLPEPPRARRSAGPVLSDDLTKVPEVVFQKARARDLPNTKALEQVAMQIAKINALNKKEADGFLKALVKQRADLAGLPFLMGDACRMKGERSQEFNKVLATIRRLLQGRVTATNPTNFGFSAPVPPAGGGLSLPPPAPPRKVPVPAGAPVLPGAGPQPPPPVAATPLTAETVMRVVETSNIFFAGETSPQVFWDQYRSACLQEDGQDTRHDRAHCENVTLARIAALMQVLAPEPPAMRVGLVQYLSAVAHPEATRALARLAVFTPEAEVRRAALDALKVRRERDYTDILLAAFHYPWPAVARHAGEAVVKLERSDLVPQLVALLEERDPREPVLKHTGDRKVPVVRELVRINHHQSCVVCHAPGNTSNVSPEAVTAPVPHPSQPLSSPSGGYGNNTIPEVLVRVDVTYLRQDFSVRQAVADANPWPEMQRFDFLVRTREVTEDEARAYRQKLHKDEPGFVTPYQRAVLAALRELTGRDTAPTAEAWRRLLKLQAPPSQVQYDEY